MKKLNGLEATKKFEFNNKTNKTEILTIKNNRKEREKKVEVELRKGKVGTTEEYKYLGDYYDRSGKNEVKIRKRMEKAKYMAHEIKRKGSHATVGKAAISVRMLLLEMTAKPSLLANIETWCNITNAEEKMLTKNHHKILCILFDQKRSTPYYGIIGETGIWPYKHVVTYKKLMFLHHLVHSEEKRMARKIIYIQQQQPENTTNWYNELKEKSKEMEVDINLKQIEKISKSNWKKIIKKQIETKIQRELNQQTEINTKLRFLKGKKFEKEKYINETDEKTCQVIMSIRLNMINVKKNYKNQYTDAICVGCFEEDETTEHLFECKKYQELTGQKLENMDEKSIQWLIKAAKYFEIVKEIREMRLKIQEI